MKNTAIVLLLSILILSFAGCAQPVSGDMLKSDKERVEAPSIAESDLKILVEGNTALALDLYQALKDDEGNLFYSPFSISMALAMTYTGAQGTTAQEMANTLSFVLPQDKLHLAFNSLDLELVKRGEGAKGKDDEGFRLNIVNAIWGQRDYKFLQTFLDVLAENYGAGLRIMDITNAPEESRVTINDWVSDRTEGKIEDLIPQGIINTLTRLVLTNAIYFNAAWQYPFNEERTQNGPFYLLDDTTATVPMMHLTESLGYTDGDGYQVVELPYDGRELSMVILLPDADKFREVEASLDADNVTELILNMGSRQVALTMPRYEFSSNFSLSETLKAMGMQEAFSMNADFSGMTGSKDLFIKEVVHKAFVSVDEAGTEAAAATAVMMQLTAAPMQPVQVIIDHPFIFFIRDIQTGSILFVGRVMNPGA